MAIPAALVPIIDLVFPPRCPLCGDGLSAQLGLCAGCWNDLVIPGHPCCSLCQRPYADTVPDGAICAPCLAKPPRHDGLAAATLYNNASRQLVLAFKHGHRIALTPLLSRLMAAKIGELGGEWLIVPVPLHRSRLWRRGFNQSALLAREIAKMKGASLLVDALGHKLINRIPKPVAI